MLTLDHEHIELLRVNVYSFAAFVIIQFNTFYLMMVALVYHDHKIIESCSAATFNIYLNLLK